MEKRYWYVILTYILMQFSGIIGVNLLMALGLFDDMSLKEALQHATGYWTIISFSTGFVIILFLLRRDMVLRDRNISISTVIFWSVLGIFLAMASQATAGMIEKYVLGIEPGSENTELIIKLIKTTPLLIIVTSVIGPILEEIIFRKIIFGTLYKRYSFFISAFVSSLIFAAVHWDFTHLLIYTAMGFVFAYLYAKTKLIIVPIMAHVMMNTIVVLVQTVFADHIEEMQKQANQLQFIFGGSIL